ncbi:metallophosphoesterase [Sunxiuqinia sp. sy24]|uniref:metallophosphoesterase n=1 Tax=Sunxiuqinia sp. sy24 TaxID=3461495 RepID=UPI004046422B
MRGIPGSGVFIFFGLVFMIELVAFFAIRQLLSHPKVKRKLSYGYWLMSAVLFGILASGFLNPEKIREASNYQFFYFVISVSFFNLIPKLLLSVAFVLSLLFRLFKARYYARVMLMSTLILSFGVMLSIGYGIVFGRKSLRVIEQEVHLEDLPKSLDKTVVVQLSDIHLGSFENDDFLKRTTNTINQFSPDLILFTGDMVNNYAKEMNGFEDEFAEMNAAYGKFAILGNHDYGDYTNWKNELDKNSNHLALMQKIEAAGFRLLLNESAEVVKNNKLIEIIGVENWGHPPFPQYADLDLAMKDTTSESFKILLTHDPAHWGKKVVREIPVSLTLSGHTHAAQSGVQLAGIEFSLMYFVQQYWGGLYQQDHQFLYVNRGLGCVGLLGRIEMAPELTVLTLRSK